MAWGFPDFGPAAGGDGGVGGGGAEAAATRAASAACAVDLRALRLRSSRDTGAVSGVRGGSVRDVGGELRETAIMAGGFVPHGAWCGRLWNIRERLGGFVLRPAMEAGAEALRWL